MLPGLQNYFVDIVNRFQYGKIVCPFLFLSRFVFQVVFWIEYFWAFVDHLRYLSVVYWLWRRLVSSCTALGVTGSAAVSDASEFESLSSWKSSTVKKLLGRRRVVVRDPVTTACVHVSTSSISLQWIPERSERFISIHGQYCFLGKIRVSISSFVFSAAGFERLFPYSSQCWNERENDGHSFSFQYLSSKTQTQFERQCSWEISFASFVRFITWTLIFLLRGLKVTFFDLIFN